MWDFLSNASALEIVALSVFLGATIATIMMYINKSVIGTVVRELIKSEADSAENALTLSELKLSKNPFVRMALSGRGPLRKLVYEAEDTVNELPDGGHYISRQKMLDLKTARFYIPEYNRIRAELRYSAKGSDLVAVIISIILYIFLAYAIYAYLPLILDFSKDFLSEA